MVHRKFRRNPIAASVAGVITSSLCSTIALQAAAQETEQSGPALEEVVVVGTRGALMRAQAVKMESSSVVEALSAEDIGKLPDSSIAESLARLPGLAGERRAGRTSGISVRGFREDFVGTTLNGRELIGIGDNRGVEYDLYPSEIMSGAVVYKSPDAALSIMGIGGTVDLQTMRPLDSPPTLTFNGSYEQNDLESYNPDFDDTGHRLAVTYSDIFADGKIGIALAAATTESPSQTEFFSVWGYTEGDITSGPYTGFATPDGIDISSRSRVLERDTYTGVFQFAPNENLTLTADYLYIDFSDAGVFRGFIEDLPNAPDGSGIMSASNGLVTSARTSGFRSVIRTDPAEKTGELTTYGFNADYFLNDTWRVRLDMAHSEADKDDLRGESYAGVGRAGLPDQGDPTLRTWQLSGNGLMFSDNTTDFSDYDAIKLAGPQSWGGSLAPIDELQDSGVDGVSFAQAQDGFVNTAIFEEELDTFRLEAFAEFDEGWFKGINFGIRYSDHSKSKENSGFFLTAPTFPSDDVIPEGTREGLTDLTWTGLGRVVAYDALGLFKSGFYTAWDAADLEPDRLGDTYDVSEEVWQAFVKVDFETMLGSIIMFGNVGLQAVSTDQEASGFNALVVESLLVEATPVKDGATYENYLPSLNLNFDIGDGQMIRFAAAKVISRPRIDHLGPGSSVKFANNINNVLATDPEEGPWTSTSGNARLEPYEADQFDLSYEWYFSDFGYLAATYFYKDLVNWHRTTSVVEDYSEFYIPGYHQGIDDDGNAFPPATFLGVDTFQEDGLTGEVDGFEFQFNASFGELLEPLDGLGLVGSAAFTDGDLDDGGRVPGLSDEVYQATAFYERGGFELRVSWTKRDDFLSEDRGGSNSITEVTRSGTELVDAQISYDFTDSQWSYLQGLRISLQGQNLTDEDDVTTDDMGRITKIESYGRNFLLTLNYSLW